MALEIEFKGKSLSSNPLDSWLVFRHSSGAMSAFEWDDGAEITRHAYAYPQMGNSPDGKLARWETRQMGNSPDGKLPRWETPQMADSPDGRLPGWRLPGWRLWLLISPLHTRIAQLCLLSLLSFLLSSVSSSLLSSGSIIYRAQRRHNGAVLGPSRLQVAHGHLG
jgi:hypothetical protein